MIQEICRGRILSRLTFPKVPYDRPRFAATPGCSVPPRVFRRICILRQRARAERVRRCGRGGRALRCLIALTRPYVAHRNHTQASERRAREALVRAGAGFHDNRCTGEARPARRQPLLARRGRTCQLASRWGRARVGRGRRSSRAGGRWRRRPDLCARLQSDVRDGRQPFLARCGRTCPIGVWMQSSGCREMSAIFSRRPAAEATS